MHVLCVGLNIALHKLLARIGRENHQGKTTSEKISLTL